MLIQKEDLCHVNTVTHEGKVVVVATDINGYHWYTVKQDGFEDSYLTQNPSERTGWEQWQSLELPDEDADDSVLEREKREYTHSSDSDKYILRSRYKSNSSAVAPVQLISSQGYLYVFRQSKTNRLWLNRFVLDGLTNTLGRKIEVRFKRSRQKHEPIDSEEAGASKSIDSVDFTDINGRRFLEPTIELSLIENLYQGWFSVVHLPTNEHDRTRWHIFAYNSETGNVDLTSLASSDEELFIVKDYVVAKPVFTKMPAIERTHMHFKDALIARGLSATRYDVQRERETENRDKEQGGTQLLKESVRVMLVVGMANGHAQTLDFAVSVDGSLSRLSNTESKSSLWRSDTRQVMLPVNTLDEIQTVGQVDSSPDGLVKGISRGEKSSVIVESAGNTKLSETEITQVSISDSPDINELYAGVHKVVDGNTFDVKRTVSDTGTWEVIPEDQGALVYNGAISSYRIMANGDLRVTAFNHGLRKGDSVQLVDAPSYNGTYSVTPVDDKTFRLDGVRWQPGTAVSARLASTKRRGVILGEAGGCVWAYTPKNLGTALTLSLWVKGLAEHWGPNTYLLQAHRAYEMQGTDGSKAIGFTIETSEGSYTVEASPAGKITEWTHVAVVVDATEMQLYFNGDQVDTQQISGEFAKPLADIKYGDSGSTEAVFQLAEVCLWDIARSQVQIRDSQYLPLKGNERGLQGYWPMTAIIEGAQRTTVDMSHHGRDAKVHGGAYVGSVSVSRTLPQSDEEAFAFRNQELVAVTERSTYREQFEFRSDTDSHWNLTSKSPFVIACAGKTSRNAMDWIEIDIDEADVEKLDDGWYLAFAHYTIPNGISLIRSFSIDTFHGEWKRLDIRKHQIARISDSVTQRTVDEVITGLRLVGENSDLARSELSKVRRLEPEQVQLQEKQRELGLKILELEKFKNNREQAISENKKDQSRVKSRIAAINSEINSKETSLAKWSKAVEDGSKEVTFYWNNDYKGKSFKSSIGQVNRMPGDWNDELTSIKVPPELLLVLYPDFHFGGKSTTFSTSHNLSDWDIPGTTTNWKNEASSFIVLTRDGHHTDLDGLKNKKWAAQSELARLGNAKGRANQEFIDLKRASVDRDVSAEIASKKKEKLDVDSRLLEVNTLLLQSASAFDRVRKSMSSMPMNRINPVNQPLQTLGAELGFLRNASILSASESCEGHVQIDYVDLSGCTRQVRYDATADSRNITFQEWTGQSERHCIDMRKEARTLILDEPTPPRSSWTIEAWIYYDNPSHKEWLALAHSTKGDEYPVIIHSVNGLDELGNLVNEKFNGCGFDMRSLTPGWHHLAAVASGEATHAVQTFYIDGMMVGQPLTAKTEQGISQIGSTSRRGRNPFGRFAEFRLWDEALSIEEIRVNSRIKLSGIEPGLRLYYPLDEGSGKKVRDKTGRNDATLSHEIWWPFTGQIGRFNNFALSFNGQSDYVEYPYDERNNPDEFTLSCWVKCISGEGAWRSALTSRHAQSAGVEKSQGFMFYAGADDHWQLWLGNGSGWSTIKGPAVELNVWVHLCATHKDGDVKLYANAEQVGRKTIAFHPNRHGPLRIGSGATESSAKYHFPGQVAEVCIWKKALSAFQVAQYQYKQLSGHENELQTSIGFNSELFNHSSSVNSGATELTSVAGGNVVSVLSVFGPSANDRIPDRLSRQAGSLNAGATIVSSEDLPLSNGTYLSTEYSTVGADRTAMMRRVYVTLDRYGVNLLSGQRIDQLEMRWIGNGQFEPTLLGYIEGPPPVPSENLTMDADYRSYISVSLSLTEDVSFNWTRSQDVGLGASVDAYIGTDVKQSIVAAPLGGGIMIESVGQRSGFKGELDFSYQFQKQSSITSSSSLNMADSLNQVGTRELDPHFAHLGKRFIPKNVGYALVVSSMADVFITRLHRTKTMIGYEVLPVENMPPDVNTITFLINPAYTMTGSLDGMTGSSATSQRFHKHVPAMRSHLGSRYPASYFRLDEAYALKQKIDKKDKDREAYFTQFNSLRVTKSAIDQGVDTDDQIDAEVEVTGRIDSEAGLTDEQKKAREAQRVKEAEKLEEDTEKLKEEQDKKASAKRIEIARRIDEQSQRSHANASFAAWQKKMERIQLNAGKRNIVNNYVWDADGGFRAESQSFANTAEHSIGGSFSLNAAIGFEGEFKVLAAAVELTAQATMNMTQTMTKTELRSQGVKLDVDLRGMESRGVTDHNDNPLMPGEKVNRYRFMSFYLEGSTENFNTFFDTVVDPEWLAGNSEEARALRQSQGKPNKSWRVMHRVTYVERPALQGFGKDIRTLNPQKDEASDIEHMRDTVEKIEKRNELLEKKLDVILARLATQA